MLWKENPQVPRLLTFELEHHEQRHGKMMKNVSSKKVGKLSTVRQGCCSAFLVPRIVHVMYFDDDTRLTPAELAAKKAKQAEDTSGAPQELE